MAGLRSRNEIVGVVLSSSVLVNMLTWALFFSFW